jgi:hypothetical protein
MPYRQSVGRFESKEDFPQNILPPRLSMRRAYVLGT